MIYQSIFEHQVATFLVALLICVALVTFLSRKPVLSIPAFVVLIALYLPVGFYVVTAFLFPGKSIEAIVAATIEAINAFFATGALLLLMGKLPSRSESDVKMTLQSLSRGIRATFLVMLVCNLYLISQSGYGVFSTSGRIQFLSDSRIDKYFVYTAEGCAWLLFSYAVFYARIAGSLPKSYLIVAPSVLLFSFLSGSKGVGVLWLINIFVCSVPYLWARHPLLLTQISGVLIAATIISAKVAASVLHISYAAALNLFVSRFFLVSDARALALDHAARSQGLGTFLEQSFRFISMRLGANVGDPLGVLLYKRFFGDAVMGGANTSLTALMTYYLPPLLYMIVGVSIIVIFLLVFTKWKKALKHKIQRNSTGAQPATAIGIALFISTNLLQDFLVFLPVVFASIIVYNSLRLRIKL